MNNLFSQIQTHNHNQYTPSFGNVNPQQKVEKAFNILQKKIENEKIKLTPGKKLSDEKLTKIYGNLEKALNNFFKQTKKLVAPTATSSGIDIKNVSNNSAHIIAFRIFDSAIITEKSKKIFNSDFNFGGTSTIKTFGDDFFKILGLKKDCSYHGSYRVAEGKLLLEACDNDKGAEIEIFIDKTKLKPTQISIERYTYFHTPLHCESDDKEIIWSTKKKKS